MSYDLHTNFGVSLIAVAPTPAASGTTFSVTAGTGSLFPAAPFNVVVWPAGANPTAANAEVIRITSKGTGDNWTGTRTQESSSARSIAVGDQICNAITAKVITDIEAAQAADAVAIAAVASGLTGRVPGGRLTLTTAVPVTVSDVTGATTLYYTPYLHNVIGLYSGTAWADFTFPELSIAIPGTTSQMYDVFIYDNAGTRTLELLAWTNDTTRATALVRQDGHVCKSGALTRLYVGSIRTTGVSGQTEDSAAKRYVWNFYNRALRLLKGATETANSWNYTLAAFQQANANAANQVDIVVGVQEVLLDVRVLSTGVNSTAGTYSVGIGEDSATVLATGVLNDWGPSLGGGLTAKLAKQAWLSKYPAVGRHFYTWLESSEAVGTTTWYGDNGSTTSQSGIMGSYFG